MASRIYNMLVVFFVHQKLFEIMPLLASENVFFLDMDAYKHLSRQAYL